MAQLGDLPKELLTEVIANVFETKDMKTVCLISRRFRYIGQAQLHKAAMIAGDHRAYRMFQFAWTLLTRPDLANCVRSLNLEIPNPGSATLQWQSISVSVRKYKQGLDFASRGLEMTRAGLIIALLPAVRSLVLVCTYRGSRVKGKLQHSSLDDSASILSALFINYTPVNLALIPGLVSATHITLRGYAGSPPDWLLATLPRLECLQNSKFVDSKLSSIQIDCSAQIFSDFTQYVEVGKFFDGFAQLTRFQLTIQRLMLEALMLHDHFPFAMWQNFGVVLTKISPLAGCLKDVEIRIQINPGEKWIQNAGPMTPNSLLPFTALNRLRLPEEALHFVIVDKHLKHNLLAGMEELRMDRVIAAGAPWFQLVSDDTPYMERFQKLTLMFRPGGTGDTEAWTRRNAQPGEPVLHSQEGGVSLWLGVEEE